MSQATRSGAGGLGAVFFLASLAGIAFYVQRQAVPPAREIIRKPATLAAAAPEEERPRLPWKDRLDLAQLELQSISDPSQGPKAAAAPPPATETAGQETPPSLIQTEKVDPAQARYVQSLADGSRILYTMDPVLQDSALTIFRNREVPYAAAVMVDLRDNALLAYAGHSTMDPQVDPLEVLNTPWAPAASTFKLITAASLLAHASTKDGVGPKSKVCFHGGLHGITDDLLRNNPARDDRCETLSSAIAQSYNLVIAKLALAHLNQQELGETARAMLWDAEIPFDFPVEKSPLHLPGDEVARAKVAAGFWHADLSPLHAATVASIFARGGIYRPPHLVQEVRGPEGEDLSPEPTQGTRVLARDVAESVAEMMRGTTVEGTARKSFRDEQGSEYIPGVPVAGKTGSLTGKRAPYLNYNWFIGFAPADEPEIAFAVLLANEPQWRIKAHYAARRLIQIYLTRREALRDRRSVHLTEEGVVRPLRDPQTGALVAQAGPRKAPPPKALPPVPSPTKAPSESAETSAAAPPPSAAESAESDVAPKPAPTGE